MKSLEDFLCDSRWTWSPLRMFPYFYTTFALSACCEFILCSAHTKKKQYKITTLIFVFKSKARRRWRKSISHSMPLMHENRLKTFRPRKVLSCVFHFHQICFLRFFWNVASAETSREPRPVIYTWKWVSEKALLSDLIAPLCPLEFLSFRKEVFVCQTKSACSLKRRLISDGEVKKELFMTTKHGQR